MTELNECPYCKSKNIKNYIPGPDDGQGAYWPKVECLDCGRTSDGYVRSEQHG